MKNCIHCGTLLFDNARFCHACGSRTLIEEIVCSKCNQVNVMGAQFCNACGTSLFQNTSKSTSTNTTKTTGTNQTALELWPLKQAFFDALKIRLAEEHNPEAYTFFLEQMEISNFHKDLDIIIRQLADNLEHMRSEGSPPFQLEALKNHTFSELLDFFITRHCQELIEIPLPEKILKYQNIRPSELSKFDLVIDYLDFENETEQVYFDFVTMPVNLLQNAGKSFLKPDKSEKLFFICDQSITGTCKEGFALTDRAIYWKAHLQKPQAIEYQHLISIVREKDWLLINNHFFNVNPSINLKMLKLLKKMQSISHAISPQNPGKH